MRYLLSSDWHVRSTTPVNRIDDYPETILNKVGFIVGTANQYDAGMLVPGDIFHKTVVTSTVVNRLIEILRDAIRPIYYVPGQHDMLNHNPDLKHSPIRSLEEAGVLINVAPDLSLGVPKYWKHYNHKMPENIYGLGWGADINNVSWSGSGDILLIHTTITPRTPPFFLRETAHSSEEILNLFPSFKYIVAGDYHIPHKTLSDNRLLINCGSLGRSNKDQLTHQPACYLIDTDKPGKVKRILIPIKPAEEVFTKASFVEKKDDKKFNEKIKNLVELLKDEKKKPKFKTIVHALMYKAKMEKKEKDYAKHVLGRVNST